MESTLIRAVVDALTTQTTAIAESGSGRDWTKAIWQALKKLADENDLILYPAEGPYKGEYLLDFVLWQKEYGPRVLVESQWQYWALDSTKALEWAFDKLIGVKGDIKVLVFDWPGLNPNRMPEVLEQTLRSYLSQVQLHLTSEHYLFVWYSKNESEVFEWRPQQDGRQEAEKILFTHYSR